LSFSVPHLTKQMSRGTQGRGRKTEGFGEKEKGGKRPGLICGKKDQVFWPIREDDYRPEGTRKKAGDQVSPPKTWISRVGESSTWTASPQHQKRGPGDKKRKTGKKKKNGKGFSGRPRQEKQGEPNLKLKKQVGGPARPRQEKREKSPKKEKVGPH